jgi:hypothetical protein
VFQHQEETDYLGVCIADDLDHLFILAAGDSDHQVFQHINLFWQKVPSQVLEQQKTQAIWVLSMQVTRTPSNFG